MEDKPAGEITEIIHVAKRYLITSYCLLASGDGGEVGGDAVREPAKAIDFGVLPRRLFEEVMLVRPAPVGGIRRLCGRSAADRQARAMSRS